MKKVLFLSIVVLSVMTAAFAFAGVVGSKHDLSLKTGAAACLSCHHPHTGQAVSINKLWNINGGQDQASYATYNNGTGNGSLTSASGFASWACMSCHDGAFDSNTMFNGGNGQLINLTYGDLLEATPDLELTNDHPVSVTQLDGAGGFKTLATGKTAGIKYFGASTNQVECASCHDVHNSSLSVDVPMLRASQAASAICVACHDK